ncbi:MAG TPA: ribonuclease HI [Bryobacteraceae bacterium]
MPEERKQVQIITDGSCLGNPGRGGWAAILRYGGNKKEIYGSAAHTTNNRMELTAAIEALRKLRRPCDVELVTDSEYLKNGITKWIINWRKRNWMTKENKPVVNRDLWEDLDALVGMHRVQWSWTRGHASHSDNNRADELATQAAREQSTSD